jgi:hypothetical protein
MRAARPDDGIVGEEGTAVTGSGPVTWHIDPIDGTTNFFFDLPTWGVSIGAAFFGESMFSRATDASKMALVHLVFRLRVGRYRLLDTQFITRHLLQFGALEVTRGTYRKLLQPAVAATADFYELGGTGDVLAAGAVLQLTTQTS